MAPRSDLLALTAQLVDIDSESFDEARIADSIASRLEAVPWLTVTRVGDNVVARTAHGARHRVVLGGHLDTVPANDNRGARVADDRVHGLGAADMKGGLAVMIDLAETVGEPDVDVSYVFYAREEVAFEHNGLRELFGARPDLLEADVAVLGEPTAGTIEAGCQGTMRVRITLHGARAHSARAWTGVNAVHRAGPLLCALADYEPRRPVIDGCRFHEGLQVVGIEGGVAGNVVPDRVAVVVNHRFAPDRAPAEAEAHVRAVVAPHLAADDEIEVTDVAAGALPGMDHPLLARLVDQPGVPVSAKLGWTDVAFFAAHGVPAVNLGPGDALVAHTRDEQVPRERLEHCRRVLGAMLGEG